MSIKSNLLLEENEIAQEEKYQFILDQFLKLNSVGLVSGCLFGMLLSKKTITRAAISAMSTGISTGMWFVDAKLVLKYNVPCCDIYQK